MWSILSRMGFDLLHLYGEGILSVQGSPKHLLLRVYESVNKVASGDSGCEGSPGA